MDQKINKQEQDRPSHQIADDEIDLVQLFQILWNRKSLIVTVALICLLAGIGYALLKKPVYEYTTTLQIGTALDGGIDSARKIGIEDPPSVKLKLEKVYLPMAINQLSAKYEGRMAIATVKENKNSNIMHIESKGLLDDGQFFTEFHTIAVSPLIANHRELIEASIKQYGILVQRVKLILIDLEDPNLFALDENTIKGKIESAQLDLAGIDDQKIILLAKKTGLKETKTLLHDQITQIERNLSISYAKRDKVISEVKEEAKAMIFLMLNSDIQQNENRLAALRERLNVSLENEGQQVEGQLAENIRQRKSQTTKIDELKSQLIQLLAQRSSDQEKQRNEISEAENKINFYQDTKTLDIASRSVSPVGTGKALVVVLAGMLGLMGGVMLAFFAEFIAKVRKQQQVPE
jgi:LPS O-antigen subunit length determinant protein (WzzB/FepE family)